MGKTSVVFVEPGAKINSQYYCEKVLGQGLLPDIRTRCGRYKWTLQQDGAPLHTARSTVQYLQRENINFIEPNMWPPKYIPGGPKKWGHSTFSQISRKLLNKCHLANIEQ